MTCSSLHASPACFWSLQLAHDTVCLPCMALLQAEQQLGHQWDALVDACGQTEPSLRPTWEALITGLAALCKPEIISDLS